MGLTAKQKHRQATRFKHWHYSYDLGDGVVTTPFHPKIQGWHVARRSVILEQIQALYGPSLQGKTCLDIACNSGFWSFALAALHPARVLAIDRSARMIEQAGFVRRCLDRPELDCIEFRSQDLLELEEGETFDLVLCLGLFYHLTDPVGAARRIHALARGVVVIDTVLSLTPEPVLEIGDPAKFRGISPTEFSFVPSASALTRILEHVGFGSVQRWQPPPEHSPVLRPYVEGTRAIFLVRK